MRFIRLSFKAKIEPVPVIFLNWVSREIVNSLKDEFAKSP